MDLGRCEFSGVPCEQTGKLGYVETFFISDFFGFPGPTVYFYILANPPWVRQVLAEPDGDDPGRCAGEAFFFSLQQVATEALVWVVASRARTGTPDSLSAD